MFGEIIIMVAAVRDSEVKVSSLVTPAVYIVYKYCVVLLLCVVGAYEHGSQ